MSDRVMVHPRHCCNVFSNSPFIILGPDASGGRQIDKRQEYGKKAVLLNDVAYSSGICRWPSGVGASITFGRPCHHVVLTHYSCQTPIKSFKDKAEKQSTRTKRQRPKDLISSKLKIASEAKPDCRTSRSGGTRLILRCSLLHRVHPELLAQRSEYCWLLAAGC